MGDWHKKWKTELIILKAGTSKNADLVVEADREITRLEAENAALLEALENLVGLCEAGDGSEEYHRHEPQEMKDARAAIKKARGE